MIELCGMELQQKIECVPLPNAQKTLPEVFAHGNLLTWIIYEQFSLTVKSSNHPWII